MNTKKFINLQSSKLKIFYNKFFTKKIELILSCILSFFLLVVFFVMVAFHGKENKQVMDFINSYPVQIIMAIFSIIVQFVFGRKYYINAYKEVFKWRNLGMNTLIALSTGISFIYSFVLMIIKFTIKDSSLNSIDTMYESGAVIITILMIGDSITDKIRKQANKDLSNLEHLQDRIVYVFNNKKIEKKDIKEIKVNEILFVSKGSRIPLDGFLLSKNALINESIITGESKP
ncbi:MAG: hypothetical protein K2N99_02615, partial [Malacoplasma sp.]|nr:hypothetical protein [Malacoplasma sp.]